MKDIILTFDLRDWKQGSELLHEIGLTEDLLFTESHNLQLCEDNLEFLLDELLDSGLEYTIYLIEDNKKHRVLL